MKLSVVIPCFNAADTIAVQLKALANQHWSEPWEVIVSDNGSTDDSVAIIETYKQKLPMRIVDSSDQPGASHARNVGVLAAASEAIAFCDADDEVAPGWVAAMGEALMQHEFVACRREYKKLNEPWTLKYRRKAQLAQVDSLQDYDYPPYLPYASSSTLGVRKSVHEAVGGYDETLLRLQDTDYCWKIQLAGTKLQFIPEAVVHYRFRHSIAGLYQQAHLWGEYNVLLYKKYRPLGMPAISLHKGVKGWLRLLKNFPQLLSKDERAFWMKSFAWRMGRLQGSIKYRVLAL